MSLLTALARLVLALGLGVANVVAARVMHACVNDGVAFAVICDGRSGSSVTFVEPSYLGHENQIGLVTGIEERIPNGILYPTSERTLWLAFFEPSYLGHENQIGLVTGIEEQFPNGILYPTSELALWLACADTPDALSFEMELAALELIRSSGIRLPPGAALESMIYEQHTRWSGYVLNLVAAVTAILIARRAWGTIVALRVTHRVRGGCCPCGYSLQGLLNSAACPECGIAIGVSTLDRFGAQRRVRRALADRGDVPGG